MTGVGLILGFATAPGGDLLVSFSPFASFSGGNTSIGQTPSVLAIVSGGSGNYAYAWAVESSDYPCSILDPAASATAFRFSSVGAGEQANATIILTVTDLTFGGTVSAPVEASYSRTGTRGSIS